MDDHLIRLTWALPLVLALGVGGLLLLKKWGRLSATDPDPQAAPKLLSSTVLSEHTRVMVVQHAGRQVMVFESTAAQLDLVSGDVSSMPMHDASRGSWGAAMRRPRG